MITLIQFANIIENGLNAALNNSELQFKVWASAGEMTKALRSGNTVTHWIPCNLISTSSANEGNLLSMGANSLSLDIAIPLKEPKTNATQTAAELAKIQNSQYPYVDYLTGIVDNYFQIAQVLQENDASGVSYTISMSAGRATTGVVDILPVLDNCLIISVFISATFLQGGVNARNIVLTIDGVQVPITTQSIGRTNRLANDVYSGSQTVKNIASATALAIDFAFPANADNTTKQAFLTLLNGQPNLAHFVQLSVGSLYDGNYFMMFDNLVLNAQNVLFAGITGSLIEVVDNPLMINVPNYMQVGKFSFADSTATSVGTQFFITQTIPTSQTVPESISTTAYANGTIIEITSSTKGNTTDNGDGTQSTTYQFSYEFPISPSFYVYNPTTQQYDFYIINIEATNYSSAPGRPEYQIVKEPTNG